MNEQTNNPLNPSQISGEMAHLIRNFNWATTILGPMAQWPASLKLTVNLMLHSDIAQILLWGDKGLMIYNDGYREFAGARHPQILGQPVLEGWPEIADFNAKIMDTCYRNSQVLSIQNQHLVVQRNGVPEDVWLDLNYSPVVDENNVTQGILVFVVEITNRVKSDLAKRYAEDALEKTQERFDLAVNAAGVVGVWDWDMSTNLMYADSKFAELFSIDPLKGPGGVSADDYLKGIHPDDLEHVEQQLNKAILEKTRFLCEYRLRQKNGITRWVIAQGVCTYDEEGKPDRFPGVLVDITDLKQSQHLNDIRLRQQAAISELSLAAITRGELDVVFELAVELASKTLDVSFAKLIQNQDKQNTFQFHAVVGFPETLNGTSITKPEVTCADYCVQINEPIIVKNMHNETRFGQSSFYKQYHIISSVNVPIIDNLSTIPFGVLEVDSRIERTFNDEDIVFMQALANIVGLTIRRKKIEQQLVQTARWETNTRTAIEKLYQEPDLRAGLAYLVHCFGSFLHFDRCVLLEFNNNDPLPIAIEYLRDKAVPSLVGKTPPWTTCPVLIECAMARTIFLNNIETDYKSNDDWVAFYRANQVIGFAAIPITYNDDILTVILLHQNAPHNWTDQEKDFVYALKAQATNMLLQARANEEIQLATARKSHFMANMSHELRTPLNAIIGYSDMLKGGLAGDLQPKQKKYINHISSSGQHLLNLVNDILDVAKIEAGKLELHVEPVDVEPLIRDIQMVMNELALLRSINIQYNVDKRINTLNADPVRLKQILLNLINNAVKFNREGGQVTVFIDLDPDNDQYCRFCIKDTGIGIPQNKLSELFQEFYQVDTMASRHREGTGLGLALTKQLVELHGGTIWASSEEGKGSTFIFTLPR